MARCIGLEKDKKLLQSELEKWENNAEHLVSDYPELVRQWSEKNGLLKPEKVTMGSNRKVWWVCEKGHEWQAPVYSRTHGNGCPVCSNRKILPGYNDLATLHPELVKQWGFVRNGDLKPDQIGCGYDRKVWWFCPEGHIWRAAVANRALPGYKHTGCLVCAGRTSIKNKQEYYHMIEKHRFDRKEHGKRRRKP